MSFSRSGFDGSDTDQSSLSSFWESSDEDDVSLSGHSSRSDSKLLSKLSSDDSDIVMRQPPLKRMCRYDKSDEDEEHEGHGHGRGQGQDTSQGRGRGRDQDTRRG